MTIVNPVGKGLGLIACNPKAQPDAFSEWFPNTLPRDR